MELFVDIEKQLADFNLVIKFNINQATLGLLGPSGSGKTMILRCIAGLDVPDKGRIILNGRTLFDSKQGINMPSCQRKVGFVFQNYALFPHMTVRQNIAFGLSQYSKSKQQQKISQYIETFRLVGMENRYSYELSGGQQQRVALARALSTEPEILLLDEPFSALDIHLREQVEGELLELLSTYQGTTLFVSHNLHETYRMCQQIAILDQGWLVDIGPKALIFEQPRTRAGAKITGCTNITSCKMSGTQHITVADWGCMLHTGQLVNDNVVSVGIRANHLKFCDNKEIPNAFDFHIQSISEMPDKIILSLNIAKEQVAPIKMELDREYWQKYSGNLPPYVQFPGDKLLLLT